MIVILVVEGSNVAYQTDCCRYRKAGEEFSPGR
jgi:hypothetical protein